MNDLFQSFYTKQSLDEFLGKLAYVEREMYNTKISVKKLLEQTFDYTLSKTLLSYCDKEKINVDLQSTFHEFVQQINKEALLLPSITVTVCYLPSQRSLQELIEWVHINISKKHLIDIQLDPTLIGGAIVTYNGKYKDYSLRRYLETYFQKTNAAQ